MTSLRLRCGLIASALMIATCGGVRERAANSPLVPTPIAASDETVVLVGAGDIAVCGSGNAERTAKLLDKIDGTVFTAGDNAYPDGTSDDFARCYDPTWGRHKARTRPAPGNHDYNTPGATPYFEYFGANAGPAGRGYYSYVLGNWQVFSLNSSVSAAVGSAQYAWLQGELTTTSAKCRLAYWHYPVFNSGFNGNMGEMRDVWRLLYENGADIVISGHAHDYERFAPLDGNGSPDLVRGVREFVVGTGGSAFTEVAQRGPYSEAFDGQTIGVLKLTLQPTKYEWEFIPAAGWTFTDRGMGTCS